MLRRHHEGRVVSVDRRAAVRGLDDEILTYLDAYADAQDTIEGIVEWWLLEHRIATQTAYVADALARLVAESHVVKWTGADGRAHYRLNPSRMRHVSGPRDGDVPAARRHGETHMHFRIQNRSSRLLIVELNDGQAVYLAPGETREPIAAEDLHGNARVAKLVQQNLLASFPVAAAARAAPRRVKGVKRVKGAKGPKTAKKKTPRSPRTVTPTPIARPAEPPSRS